MRVTPPIMDEPFGRAKGTAVRRYTLSSPSGIVVRILTYGAIVQELWAPDARGASANVTLGLPTLDDYVRSGNGPYFGAVIGRVANRIARGTFTLDGVEYHLPLNQPPNSLHGGMLGFDKHVWRVVAAEPQVDGAVLTLHLSSPNGDQGYPGNLDVEATYSLAGDELAIAFRATTDAPTVVNLTSHMYWNLGGEGAGPIDDHVLMLRAGYYAPVDSTLIPTGEIVPVAGTGFDFTRPRAIGPGAYDHNLALAAGGPGPPAPAARIWEPTSGRSLTLTTDQPGIQLYSGDYLDGTLAGPSGVPYRQRAGFALEPQRFPDAPNQPTFASPVLRPGETYTATTIFELRA